MDRRETRIDIQALRGYAVLVVVLYHAKLSFLPSGYLGVDVFFVISGFLITRLIKDSLERGDFRFSEFYFRRAKRLLPAAYTVLLATTLLAPLFLGTAELKDLRAQIIGAVTFTGNIVLWSQSGYFSGGAELKPLLHVWSLAIEEQYYFFLPALLAFVPRRFWMGSVLLILAASLALCLMLPGRDLTFYLLPTRAWELMIGSVGALLLPSRARDDALRLLFWPALLVLAAAPFIAFAVPHPGAPAILVCVATLLVMLRAHPGMNAHALTRLFGKLGDLSYPLYLVHWPLFAFFNNTWMGKHGQEEPLSIRLALLLFSLLLAWLLHRYVEEPVRHSDIKRTARVLTRTLATSFGIILLNAGVAHAVMETRGSATQRRPNYGFSQSCVYENAFTPMKECRNSDTPSLLVWGDSFAMHLVPGLVKSTPPAWVVQATRPVCGPFLGVAVVREHAGRPRAWAESCIAFSKSVLDYLKHADSIQTVVLSSPLDYLVNPDDRLLRQKTDGSYELIETGLDPAIAAFSATVEAVRALGKRVIVVAPPPMSGVNIGRCQERLQHKLPVFGTNDNCNIDVSEYHQERAAVLQLLDALPAGADVAVIRFDTVLCDEKTCRTSLDGINLYNDKGHLSEEGIVHIARHISLLDTINRQAR